MKMSKLHSNLLFLKECKRRDICPLGLRTPNKLQNTIPCRQATELQHRQSKQWLSLSIRQTYSKMEKGAATVPIGYWLAASDILDRLQTWQGVLLEKEDAEESGTDLQVTSSTNVGLAVS